MKNNMEQFEKFSMLEHKDTITSADTITSFQTEISKGSDDQVPDVRKMVEDDNYLTPVDWLMDRIKWIHRETYDYLIKEGQYDVAKRTENAILNKANELQSSQTEISDENAYTNGYLHGYNAAISELPKEISDEEIRAKALEVGFTNTLFIDGAKWYRERFKQLNEK